MELLGDLERTFATAIYPNRALFAVLGLVLLVILIATVRRRWWDLVARRRPRRTATAAALALAVAVPLGWYLASPLVISSTIDEPAPNLTVSRPSPALPSVDPAATPTSLERSGRFTGADEFHFGSGTARLIETSPGSFTVRLEDFAVRNGPDLYVYLSPSPNGYTTDAIDAGRLKADRGNQNYAVPQGADGGKILSVVIWCKQFGVVFATAPLG